MAQTEIKSSLKLDFEITLKLTLSEAKALNEIVGYGHKSFLEGFYKHLGQSYMKAHEQGLISLFDTIKNSLPKSIHKADDMVRAINQIKKV